MNTRPVRIGVLIAGVVVASAVAFWPRSGPQPLTPLLSGATVDADIAYGDHPRQRYDVYLPDGDGPFPAVVWVHGGGWTAGDKGMSMPVWNWTEHGYAVVSINYRYAIDGDTIAESTSDAIAAVTHLLDKAERFRIDPTRVGVYGFSAGGHLAAMIGSADIGVAAVVATGSPTDFEPLVDPERSVFEIRTPADAAATIRDRLGCPDGECAAQVADQSPARQPAGSAPVLVLHGEIDSIVDPTQATALIDHLVAQEAPVDGEIIDGVGHAPMEPERVRAFFDEHVRR